MPVRLTLEYLPTSCRLSLRCGPRRGPSRSLASAEHLPFPDRCAVAAVASLQFCAVEPMRPAAHRARPLPERITRLSRPDEPIWMAHGGLISDHAAGTARRIVTPMSFITKRRLGSLASASALVATVAVASMPAATLAAGPCTATGFVRDGINLTAAQIGGTVTGDARRDRLRHRCLHRRPACSRR